MRNLLVRLVAIGIVYVAATAFAQSDTAELADIPNLVGSWECDKAPILFRDGEWSNYNRSIDVTEQRSALFQGTQTWLLESQDDVTGHQEGRRRIGGSISIVGVIDFDNQTFRAGAFGDEHTHQGRLLDRNTFQITSVEPGDHAWVSRTTCRRIAGN